MTQPLRVIDRADLKSRLDAFQARCDHLLEQGQHLFARIRASSKYHDQTDNGEIFPIVIGPGPDYKVQGGPGGQYRLQDVDLFVAFDEDAPPVQITFEK